MLAQSTQEPEVLTAIWAPIATSTFPGSYTQPSGATVVKDPVSEVVSGQPAVAVLVFEVSNHRREFPVLIVAAKTFEVGRDMGTFVL
jgi:hypothetical protein